MNTKLGKERERLERRGRALAKQLFGCEADALAAVNTEVGKLTFHDVDVSVHSEEKVMKRERRGRPRVGEPAPTR